MLDDDPPVAFWLRAYPESAATAIPDLSFAGVNAATVDQDEPRPGVHQHRERHGEPAAQPGERLGRPGEPGPAGRGAAGLGHLDAGRRPRQRGNNRVYLLDAASGTVACGDTLRGRAFQTGERVRALTYRCGGGSAGNVAPGAISTIDGGAAVTVTNPSALAGGADAETIDQAMTRSAGLSNHDRAVTASDFAQLAAIQGVGRAECLPHFYPPTLDQQAAGVVTVIVWPSTDLLHPGAPVPGRALLSAVCAQLDPRRLVTTELYVVPPTYHQIAVSVGAHAQPGYSGNAVCTWVETVLRHYLSPMPPYGPVGDGWRLGPQVFAPELMAAALQVEGIDYLEPVQLAELDGNGNWQAVDPSQPIALQPWEVVQLSSSTVVPARATSGPAHPRASAAEHAAAEPRPDGPVLTWPRHARSRRSARPTSGSAAATRTPPSTYAEGMVSLAWSNGPGGGLRTGSGDRPGLTFDPGGCLYHGDLPTGQVQWIAWRPGDPLSLRGEQPAPVDLLAAGASVVRPVRGGVEPAPPGPGPVVDRGRSRPAFVCPGRRDRHDLGLRPRRPGRVPACLVGRARRRPGRRWHRRARCGRGPRPATVPARGAP